jgi:hypothetical protein
MDRKDPSLRVLKATVGQPRIMSPLFSPMRAKSDAAISPITRPPLKSLPAVPVPDLSKPDPVPANPTELFQTTVRSCLTRHPSESSLQALSNLIADPAVPDTPENSELCLLVITVHLYRPPKPLPPEWYSPSDFFFTTDRIESIDWEHRRIIFDLAIAFFDRTTFQPATVSVALIRDLILMLASLFKSPDSDEQEKVTLLFLKIFEKIKTVRSFALKVFNVGFHRLLCENEPFTTARTLLKCFRPIVAGFQTPLRRVNVDIFLLFVLPLHSNPYLDYFSSELFAVVAEYLQKDHSLVLKLYSHLVRIWPHFQPTKQILFLNEIGWFASFVDDEMVDSAITTIHSRVCASIRNPHAAVAEEALMLWEIPDFVWLMTQHPTVSYALVLTKIYDAATAHWSPVIRGLGTAVLKVMRENNQVYFDTVGFAMKKMQQNSVAGECERTAKWVGLVNRVEDENMRKELLSYISGHFIGYGVELSKSAG